MNVYTDLLGIFRRQPGFEHRKSARCTLDVLYRKFLYDLTRRKGLDEDERLELVQEIVSVMGKIYEGNGTPISCLTAIMKEIANRIGSLPDYEPEIHRIDETDVLAQLERILEEILPQ